MHKQNDDMGRCIEQCLACWRSCQETAVQHCLPLGGKHTEPDHFRLMLDCAEICRTAAAMMANGSQYHAATCGICAEICRACAASCRAIGDMDECVDACERCADSCEQMAGMRGSGAGSRSGTSAGSVRT